MLAEHKQTIAQAKLLAPSPNWKSIDSRNFAPTNVVAVTPLVSKYEMEKAQLSLRDAQSKLAALNDREKQLAADLAVASPGWNSTTCAPPLPDLSGRCRWCSNIRFFVELILEMLR